MSFPLLVNGDRMGQAEFHARYEACPENQKFELVGGIVYMASPESRLHSLYCEELGYLLGVYRRHTPGIESAPDATAILGEESEPQPDLSLRLEPEYGGQSHVNEGGYYTGPPEFAAEIAYSSRAIDLHKKRSDYERAGVLEYLVVRVEEPEMHWFNFASRGTIKAHRKGVFCSKVFPGLWLHRQALLERDSVQTETVLRQGLASRTHAAFVKRLEHARKRKS